MLPLITLTTSLLLLQAPSAGSKVWPGFRGSGDSHSAAKNLPLKWSDTENVAWQVDLPGFGYSSPVVWNDRAWVTSVEGPMQDKLHLLCVDFASGKTLWKKEFQGSQGVETSDYQSKASPTPVVDGERLYAFWETGDLVALSHSGDVVWQRSLVKDFGRFKSNHGIGSSPVLAGDTLVLTLAHEGGSYMLAVDAKTGKDRWKKDRDFKTSWSTPLITAQEGRKLIVQSTGSSVDAYDLESGDMVWTVTGLKGNTVPSPSPAGEMLVIGSSERGMNLAVRTGGKGDVTGSHIAWRTPEAASAFGSPVVLNDRIYLVNKTGVLYCLDVKTGTPVWDTRISASCWAAPVAAGDRIYCFSTDGGATVLKAGDKPEKLAENKLTVADKVFGVAAVDGAFLIRSGSRLTRVGKP